MELVTLEAVKAAGQRWHELDYKRRLVVLQNMALDALKDYVLGTPLTEQTIVDEEVRISHALMALPFFTGPFASTHMEGPDNWWRYVRGIATPEQMEMFRRASAGEFWAKYTGVVYYEPQVMGQVVHAFSLIAEAWFETRDEDIPTIMSPGNLLPAYSAALASGIPEGPALFMGAFSMQTIADIDALRQYALAQRPMEVIDLEGYLAQRAAEHYDMQFHIGDALGSELPPEKYAAIFTNQLVPSLGDGFYYDPEVSTQRREPLLAEMYRLLKPGGKAFLGESPLYEDPEADLVEQARLDHEKLIQQVHAAGFSSINIDHARRFISRACFEAFRKEGTYHQSQTVIGQGTQACFLITLTK